MGKTWVRSSCWMRLVYSLGAKLKKIQLSEVFLQKMFPPCSLETVRVEVGEVLKMTGQSIEAFERVKVLDMIDPCPSAIIHQTEGSSHLQKRMLRQKKWHPKEHEPLPNNGFQAPLSSQLLTFTSSYLASKNMEDVSIDYWSQPESNCQSQLSRAPDCAKAQQSRNCGACFFSLKVVGVGKQDDKLWPSWVV